MATHPPHLPVDTKWLNDLLPTSSSRLSINVSDVDTTLGDQSTPIDSSHVQSVHAPAGKATQHQPSGRRSESHAGPSTAAPSRTLPSLVPSVSEPLTYNGTVGAGVNGADQHRSGSLRHVVSEDVMRQRREPMQRGSAGSRLTGLKASSSSLHQSQSNAGLREQRLISVSAHPASAAMATSSIVTVERGSLARRGATTASGRDLHQASAVRPSSSSVSSIARAGVSNTRHSSTGGAAPARSSSSQLVQGSAVLPVGESPLVSDTDSSGLE